VSSLPAELSPRPHLIAPDALGADRHLEVAPGLRQLFPERALVRGQIIACTGDAAVSIALAGAAQATVGGSWLAVVGVPALGIEAANEIGVELGRSVFVEVDRNDHPRWTQIIGAVVEGFEVIIAAIPDRIPERAVRSVRQRLRARGAVLFALAPAEATTAELAFDARTSDWLGIDRGAGLLRARRVSISVSGRRTHRHRSLMYWLPGPSGVVEPVQP
jgi:hypothetical protein